jgi:hypothetical protein
MRIMQGCQMVYLKTKNTKILAGLEVENFGIFYSR